jgi:hypothetical protein
MTHLTTAFALVVSFVCTQSIDAQEPSRTERRVMAAVREWRDPPKHARESLVIESISLRDTRVADAAMAAAENGRLPLEARLAALRVILTFVIDDPRAAISFDSRVPAPGDLSVPLGGSSPHTVGVAGAQPVTPALIRKLRMRLERLASSETNRQVRSAAKDVLTAASRAKRAP